MTEGFSESMSFTVATSPATRFQVFRMTGEEEISRPFLFRLDLVSDDPGLDLGGLVNKAATLAIERNGESREIHGMVGRITQGPPTSAGQYVYHADLVPRLKRLEFSRQNQVHGTDGEVSVVDIIRNELTANALKGTKSAVAGRMSENDFDLRISRDYPMRDYVVQFRESDLAFLSRQAENAGIFYFFEHQSGRDVVVFGDFRVAFSDTRCGAPLSYRQVSGLANPGEASVRAFTHTALPMPQKVVVRDHNYRMPHLSLVAEQVVDPNGHGVIVEFGEHFRTPAEGARVASVRAEEIRCHSLTFSGASDCIHMSAGYLFNLQDHFRDDYNSSYCLTRVTHEMTVALPGVADIAGGAFETAYSNRFDCIDRLTEFRPSRRTPKPVMAGLTGAVVDAAGPGKRAELDEQGRYKVRSYFDMRGEDDGKSSHFVRKAEPYGGDDVGMHFPLLKNTEVVIACTLGDPDRPIIVGAVPNPRNRSVVISTNQTSNLLRSANGTTIGIDDGNVLNGGGGGSAANGATLAPQRTLDAGADLPGPGDRAPLPASDLHYPRAEDAASSLTDESRLYLSVTGTDATSATDNNYMRFGSALSDDSSDEDSFVSDTDYATKVDGILTYTPDHLTQVVCKDHNSHIAGSMAQRIKGGRSVTIGDDSLAGSSDSATDSTVVNGDQTVSISGDWSETIGGDAEQSIGGDQTVTVDGAGTVSYGGDHDASYGGNRSTTVSGKTTNTYGSWVGHTTTSASDGTFLMSEVGQVENTYYGSVSNYYFWSRTHVKFLSETIIQLFGTNSYVSLMSRDVRVMLMGSDFHFYVGAGLNKFQFFAGMRITVAASPEITAKNMTVGARNMILQSTMTGIGRTAVEVKNNTLEAKPTGFALEVYEFMKMQV